MRSFTAGDWRQGEGRVRPRSIGRPEGRPSLGRARERGYNAATRSALTRRQPPPRADAAARSAPWRAPRERPSSRSYTERRALPSLSASEAAKIHRGPRRRSLEPNKEAGCMSAVVTLDQRLPNSIAIGRGPYTSRHDRFLRNAVVHRIVFARQQSPRSGHQRKRAMGFDPRHASIGWELRPRPRRERVRG
jgi:hypothetical protein